MSSRGAARASLNAGKSDTLALAFTVLLTIVLIATGLLYVARAFALFPLEHDVTEANSTGDDWLIYHRNALSVLNDGLSMPIVDQAYFRPGGYGYAYFIAAVYAVAGVRSEAVYLVQALLLVAAIAGTYAVFRHQLSALTALAFLVALSVFMYIDMYRALTFRLLSENLFLPLLPLVLFCLIKGEATAKLAYVAIGGFVCGLCFLVRPNSLLLGPAAAAAILLFRARRPLSWRTQAAAVLLATCAAAAALLPLRNYVVTGRPSVALVTSQSDWSGSRMRAEKLPFVETVATRLTRYGRRAAYVLGITQFMRPAFRFRPHWLALWCAFFWYLGTLFRRKVQFWEVLLLALSVSYYAPIMEAGDIANYGNRMLVPGLPLILVLAARGLDGRSRWTVRSSLPALRPGPA